MASPSSSLSSRNWSYNVFTSFHGPDVRKTLLSHMREQFNRNGITMFDDQGIERSAMIAPSLTKGIRESRIAIVILSKKYASSSWCLDELVEILECKKAIGQIVMTIFYGVEPSDVRNQTGEFGIAFDETCERKKDGERQKWSRALNYVGNIAGEDFLRCDNEANMIKKIARDVSEKLNATPSRDFDGMVGLEAHLKEMECLLDLDYDGVKIVAISGPAGIGKSTIARALQSRLSHRFQLTCFVDNLRGSYHSGRDEYGLKLGLQEQFLSNILKQDGVRIFHSGVIEERLCKQRVLIILDDVNHIMQLEALANEPTWFGPGSRIVITTENKELLQKHRIHNTYHVGFPSSEQALEILCRYAFMQSYPSNGFTWLARRVTNLCGNLPLGLRVMGSSLRGKNEEEWKRAIRRLDTIFDQKNIEEVLRVGYENLHENEKFIFVHIAVFFNNKDGDIVEDLIAEDNNNLDIKDGLQILANKSLIDVSTCGEIVMHKLLQQVGTKVVREEEPWKHKILIKAKHICDVLEDEDDRESKQVSGILFDTSGIKEVFINKRAFKRMSKLRFLKVTKSQVKGYGIVHLPKKMDFPRCLRLFDWEGYPGKAFPRTFNLKYIVELNMQDNELKKLWEGTPHLSNLKRMDLSDSSNLKELPDLSNATNLERLILYGCCSLEKLPSSIGNLHKLERLDMTSCLSLQIVQIHLNLESLEIVHMGECSQLTKIPEISTNITQLEITDTMLEELPHRLWSRLEILTILGSLKESPIEKLPDWIKDFHGLEGLYILNCSNLVSLPELPRSLKKLLVYNCESLETLTSFHFFSEIEELYFINCFQLSGEALRIITSRSSLACLPGRTLPADLDHRAKGNFLTIRSDFRSFTIWAVVSPETLMNTISRLICQIYLNGCLIEEEYIVQADLFYVLQTEHLFICDVNISENDGWLEQDNEISFEFHYYPFSESSSTSNIDVIECGVSIPGSETDGSDASSSEQDDDEILSDGSDEFDEILSDGSDEFDEPRVKRLKI